jgi:hypothetical protein
VGPACENTGYRAKVVLAGSADRLIRNQARPSRQCHQVGALQAQILGDPLESQGDTLVRPHKLPGLKPMQDVEGQLIHSGMFDLEHGSHSF